MRAIVHLDADAFFASVEQAADPRLRGRAVAVGGDKRGIIASASYEARRFGIYTPMPTARARKFCPKLIVLPGDFEKYERFSRWMFSYAYDFTPDVEIGSIDEGYFDLTGARRSPVDIAQTIRQAIGQSLKISVSEGIGASKLVSQIASKLHKPAAFLPVPPGHETAFLHPLPNGWLPGVGPQTARRLDAAGLAFIGQIAATPLEMLELLLGKMSRTLREFAQGIDDRPVVPVSAPAKSYSEQETFPADTTDEEFLEAVLRRMADHLMAKVRAETKSIRTVTVKVRYNDMAEDQCSESLAEPTDLETDLYGRLRPWLRQAWKRRVSLRLVSLKLSNVYASSFDSELPLDRAAAQRAARRRLATVIDELRRTRGPGVIQRGHDLTLALPKGTPQVDPTPPTETPPAAFSGPPSGISPGPRLVAAPPSRTDHALPPPIRVPAFRRRVAYVPLAVQSYYSFLDSLLSPAAVVRLAQHYELPAIALTDQANLHGAVAFVQAARQTGIKPILGARIQWRGIPVRLYVTNPTGYHNLCRMLSAYQPDAPEGAAPEAAEAFSPANASLPGNAYGSTASFLEMNDADVRVFSKTGGAGRSQPAGGGGRNDRRDGDIRPRFSPGTSSLLTPPAGFPSAEFTEGLIAVSTDPRLAEGFPGRFYLEVAGPERLRKLAAPAGLPRVAALPIHYAEPGDRWKYDVVQSIRTRTLLRQAHPDKRLDGEFHGRAPGELAGLFPEHPELLAHTLEIADRCEFEFPFGKPQFPAFRPPDGSSSSAYLRTLVERGLRQRYPARHAQVHSKIDEELAIIDEVGYAEYFLVVWEVLQECRRRGIDWLTRGSAADSLVCYCLGISSVCPLRFDLYFRRFLNRDRMQLHKLPDIDLDFPHDRKDDVIDLIFEKYGGEHTAVVGGFSTFQGRSAVGDIAKVLGVSEHQARQFTERFPWAGARDIAGLVQRSLECRDLPFQEEPYSTALQMAAFLDGFPRYPKMHPCGVVLSRQPMAELTPTFQSQKGYPTTHFDMDAVEAIGLVKMDILAQGGLAAMRDVQRTLAARAVEIHLDRLEPWQDPHVWEMIAGGGSRAVHHIESPAMVGLCRQCNVRDIDGLIAIVSVIRPGAANEQKKARFTRRYQGLEPVTYPHPSLEACLKSTFGLVVYEEHILQICEVFAGLPPGRADVLRRALSKLQTAVIDQFQEEFVASARSRGQAEDVIAHVWELVSGFAGYAFCKAHSTAYGVEAYQSAWLKRYYPVEFMAAVLSNGKGFYHPLVYVLECHRLGIPLLPPRINEPGPEFAVAAVANSGEEIKKVEMQGTDPLRGIRVPVTRVKGLTGRTRETLLRERARGEFVSLADFYRRVFPQPEEIEALVRVGAFDGLGQGRTAQFWEFQRLQRAYGQAGEPRQGWLLPRPGPAQWTEVPRQEPTRRQRLEWETELLDFPVSGHPLDLYDTIAWDTYCPVARLGEQVGESVVVCGLVIEQRLHHQVTGELMKFLTLADWTGMVETELFASTYRSYGLATVRYPVLEITATVEPFENGRGFSLRVHRAGRPRSRT